ncbi:mucin-7-like [Camellia sinensis]|uniref:mucin-7-like n=1 Tax=Camellia sinensis TaxID=4442 RepID=UPI001035DFFD|nr:mucin-7-like [Camellia sinensis]
MLPDVPKKKRSKSPPSATTPPTTSSSQPDQGSTSNPAEWPSTSAPQLIPPSQRRCRRRCRTAIAAEMGRKKAVAEDLLVDIPDTVNAQPAQSQPQPKPKPKRLKKAQPKATVTQIDTEDALPISKLAESEKTPSAAEKRPAEAEPSQSTRSKRPRSESATTSGSMKSDAPWAPPITIEDKPVRVGDSAIDLEVGVASQS